MPATFAHCLMAQKAIDEIGNEIKKADPQNKRKLEFAQKIGEKNNFVIMGAAGPDYPYLTDILMTSILQISHTWANRMHYENTLLFIKEGVGRLALMKKREEPFSIRLAWFCGFVSHVLADSYMHPVINSIVNGAYIFTHEEHALCEIVQDICIFKKLTEEDIVSSNPRGGNFGYLRILEECSDPNDEDRNRIHPEIREFWRELLEAAHPNAKEYFEDIAPDRWHHNYKGRVNFVADPGAIFRHVIGLTGRAYKRDSEIITEQREKYIDKIRLPNGQVSDYYTEFSKAVSLIVATWIELFEDIDKGNPDRVATYIRDWNLDTGVDESRIDLWPKKEG
jgi:hypothetical protein